MKRLILSSAFALLMMFALPAQASAEEFCALGSHSAGSELNCYNARISKDALVSAEGLPDGLYLAETPDDSGKDLSLRGKTMSAGSLNFSVTVSEAPELINCSAEILAARPIASLSGDVRCAIGETPAMAMFPLFVLGLWEVIFGDKERWPVLTIGAMCVFQSHMISTGLAAALAMGPVLRSRLTAAGLRPVE